MQLTAAVTLGVEAADRDVSTPVRAENLKHPTCAHGRTHLEYPNDAVCDACGAIVGEYYDFDREEIA